MKVFLGGTENGSRWRELVIPQLKVNYFDPVVKEKNYETQQLELVERKKCDLVLYVLTPKMDAHKETAEVIEVASKRKNKFLYCFLPEDEGIAISEEQRKHCEETAAKATEHGAKWFKSLDEVVAFLNATVQTVTSKIHFKQDYNHVFISYGRKHSLPFARKLFKSLADNGITAWFDMNDIPLGVDFQEQIDEGIENADNFVYIISPHSVKSEYCLREVLLAIRYGKRIIPILHVEPSDCWDKMHPVIEKLNWVYMRETYSETIPYEDWIKTDNYDQKLIDLMTLIRFQDEPIRMHTIMLHLALQWERDLKLTEELLVGKDRTEALEWLTTKEFKSTDGAYVQPPYQVTDIQAEYICESEKNAHNLMTDVFFSFASEKKDIEHKVAAALMKNGITSWTHDVDIKKGSNFNEAMLRGIEQADSFVYLISKEAFASQYCKAEVEYAVKLNKRVLPLLIEITDDPYQFIPQEFSSIQYIDFTCALSPEGFEIPKGMENRRDKSPFDKKIAQLYGELVKDRAYYNLHKVFMVHALKWQTQNKNDSILLRGFSLENAKSWLELGVLKQHKPIDIHKEFITTSASKATLITSIDVFVSYSRTDSEFARQINENLQLSGKTTWFDQESIASGADFQTEINKGIENSNNFLFIISPGSVESIYCAEEVEFAKSLNKRFVTALCRPTPIPKIHPDLASVQWIDFTKKDFLIAFGELNRTLDFDREHVRDHTKWALRSMEWKTKDENKDLLLKGTEFAVAQEWLNVADNEKKKPFPTETQRQFIDASHKAILYAANLEKRRVRILRSLLIAAFILLIISVFVSIIAYAAKQTAVKERERAEIERHNAEVNEKKAIESKKEADRQRAFAEDEQRKAKISEEKAVKAQIEAEKNFLMAEQQRKKAEDLLVQVKKEKAATEEQKRIALENYDKAVIAEKKAKDEKDKAMFQLYLFNAKEFANKSTAMTKDKKLKAFLALTAYKLKQKSIELSKQYGYTMQNDPEILEALQRSYLTWNPNNFNYLFTGSVNAMEPSANLIAFSHKDTLYLSSFQPNTSPNFPKMVIAGKTALIKNAYLQSLSFSTDNNKLALGTTDGRLLLFDVASNKKEAEKRVCAKTIVAVSFIEDQKLIVAESSEGNSFLYDYAGDKVIVSNLPIKSLVQIEGNQYLALDEKGIVQSYELKDKKLQKLNNVTENTNYKSLTINKKLKLIIAVASNGELFAYRYKTANFSKLDQAYLLPYIHNGIRTLVQFSSDNKWLATGSLDGYICLWNIEAIDKDLDKLVPIIVSNNKKQIFSLCFDPKNQYLYYGDNSYMYIYPLDIQLTYNQLNTIMNNQKLPENQWQYYKRGELEKPE